MKYKDKKVVTLQSSCSTGTLIDSGKKNRYTNEPIMITRLVHLYNQNMNGVDQFDQHIQYYSFNRKNLKVVEEVLLSSAPLGQSSGFLDLQNEQSREEIPT